MQRWSAWVLVLIAASTTAASAQDRSSEDTRTQYPAFLVNSYFSVTVGSIGYLFSGRQLEPGFEAESIEKPRLAVRADLFGHQFSRYLSAQVTYMRPVRFVTYHNVNGTGSTSQVSNAYAGLTFLLNVPLTARLTAYGEGGGGVTSRSGFTVGEDVALQSAHYAAGLLGGGVIYRTTPNIDLVVGATYSPGRRSFSQPSTRLYTSGLRYQIRRVPPAQVEENRRAGFAFPASVLRFGYSTNLLAYGVNTFFSRTVPIFWGGHVETRRGFTLDYERNVFHTKKVFAFDLGASASSWKSNGNRETFRTLSAYPLFRFFVARPASADIYVAYSLAGPTFINPHELDGRDTGAHFTFQDFMGAGAFLGARRRLNLEIGIKHYSNGNLFTSNASIKIPLTLMLGVAF